MAAEKSRFVAFWASTDRRAAIWFRLTTAQTVLLALSLSRVLMRPREVIRIGCDGIPEVVRINEAVYAEPAEQEIRAFAATLHDLLRAIRQLLGRQ